MADAAELIRVLAERVVALAERVEQLEKRTSTLADPEDVRRGDQAMTMARIEGHLAAIAGELGEDGSVAGIQAELERIAHALTHEEESALLHALHRGGR